MVRRDLLRLVVAALATAALSRPVDAHGEDRPDIAVVVPANLDVEGLTRADLREMLLGNRRFWRGGSRVELVVTASASPARAMFVEHLCGMSETQFRQYWIGQVFRGRATSAPRAVPDRVTALALVTALPGALALVEAGETPPTVKVLPIDGRLPGDPGYALR
jgi:hypothetical protein